MERDFFTVLDQTLARLHSRGRVTYKALQLQFGLEDAHLTALKEELLYTHPEVVDDAERGLIWTAAPASPRASAPPEVAPVVLPAVPLRPTPEVVLPVAPVRSTPEAERRQLTVLFCDLVGSTQLSGQLDPEDLRVVVRTYQAAAAEVIQRYEGHIAQYLGDGLLVYFGYPTAHEDDARRAVHTGLGIVQAITTLNTRLAARYSVQLAVRLGIHTGPVVVGVMGGGGRHEHLALGETPNIAARLEALAPANTVVVSAVTARLLQGAFVLEDLGAYTLHGVAEPMAVSCVRGLLAAPSRDEEFFIAAVPVLVGREEESGLLRRRWEQSKAGLGQVVFISGEAGIGKSALVERLRAQVRAEGLPRIAFRCSPYHINSALYPIVTHIEHLLQFAPSDLPATKVAKLEVGLRPYGLPLAEVVPHLEEGTARYRPDQRRAPIFRMGQDPGVGCRAHAALTLQLLGYPEQALACLHDALALAHELSHPYSLAFAWCWAAFVAQLRRDVPAVHEQAEATVTLSTEQGFPFWTAMGTSFRGWALAVQGQGEEGRIQVRQGIAAGWATGAALFVPYFCTMLAEAYDHLGRTADGLQALAEAYTLVEQHEERWWEAEIYRLRGVLLLRQPETPPAEAEAWLQRALGVARRQEAKSLELRAAMGLSRLWQRQGKRQEACDLLAPIYAWFTEGFDTADLQEAKALLEALAEGHT